MRQHVIGFAIAMLCLSAPEAWGQDVASQTVAGGQPCAAAAGHLVRIVAFGGSNTYGKNLPRSDAYPAQLEKLLIADGYTATVKNEGVSGITTPEELDRLNGAVPDGTDIVIFQPGGNDAYSTHRHGALSIEDVEKNIGEIVQRLQARKISVVLSAGKVKQEALAQLNVPMINELNQLVPREERQPDGQHLTPAGYGLVAQAVRPVVEQVICKRLSPD
ncbi:GDSL-type esterase/lipase family protein [Burkholderia guangdongensis]|uniref:GDSL-type esterase/lipase family protein n=1 Tax=Burkholderia guangdongensis TaxID=1792500 RepID=UPI0015CEB5B0|nr:GDSL-type esterase/lipase family protein [Burkholderia guangdongensis]